MRNSIFSTALRYCAGMGGGLRSVVVSAFSVLPYWFGTSDSHREVTEQYPDPVSSRTEDDLPPRTRGLLFNDIDRCTGCRACADICPVDCIQVDTEIGPQDAKKWVSVFDVDFGVCLFCGFCVEACQPRSLVHTKQFEGAVFSSSDLVATFGRGKVSDELREKWNRLRLSRDEFHE